MNAYPSWIERIPEMIERLALVQAERIDRLLVERLFDLRRTAAKEFLGRMGASLCGHSFVISRGLLMARLREAQENPDWKWEAGRRRAIRKRIEEMRPPGGRRFSVVPVPETLREELEGITAAGLPATIQLAPGCVTIHCQDMPDLLQQLVQINTVFCSVATRRPSWARPDRSCTSFSKAPAFCLRVQAANNARARRTRRLFPLVRPPNLKRR